MNTPNTKNGHVYIMEDTRGMIKVGHSINPEARLTQIKCGNPGMKLKFVSKIISNRESVEKECHKALAMHSVGGEWFDVDFKKTRMIIESAISDIGEDPEDEGNDNFEEKLSECLMLASGYQLKISANSDKGKVAIFSYAEIIAKTENKKHLDHYMGKRDFEQYLEAIEFFSKVSLGFEG